MADDSNKGVKCMALRKKIEILHKFKSVTQIT